MPRTSPAAVWCGAAGLSHPSGATGRSPAGEGWIPKVPPRPALLLERDHRQEEPRAEPARGAGGPGRELLPCQHRCGVCCQGSLCTRTHPSSGSSLPGGVQIQTSGARAVAYSRSLGPAVLPDTGSSRALRGALAHGGPGVGTGTGAGTGTAPRRRRIPRVCRGNSRQSRLAVLPRCVALVSPLSRVTQSPVAQKRY